MGREIVYCWKCATRLQGADFDDRKAFRVGDKVSCPDCVDELVADLPAEEQEAILNPPKRDKSQPVKKITSTNLKPAEKAGDPASTTRRTGTMSRARTGTTGAVPRQRTGTTGPVPTASTGVRKRVTASIPKVQPPADDGEEDEEDGGEAPDAAAKKKKLLIFGGVGGGLFLLIVVLLIVVLTRKPEAPKKRPGDEVAEDAKPKVTANSAETPKEKAVKALLKEAFDLKAKTPDSLGLQLKKFREAETAAEGSNLLPDVKTAIDDVLVKIDKAISAVDEQVKPQYTAFEYKAVIETYEKSKSLHDVPEWTDRLDTKIKLVRNKIDDTFHQFKKKIEAAKEAGEDPKIDEVKATVAKWEMPEYVEKFDKFLALLGAAEPDPTKNPPADVAPKVPGAPALRPLTAAMKSFMPAWQGAMILAFGRDYSAAATEMSGLGARADSDEAKKAAAEDAQTLKDIGERYSEILKTAGETPKLQALTLEYQDKPGEWKKITGKATKVDPTRMEFQPDPKDGKTQPPMLIEYTDLNAGSLAVLYKARKKTTAKKDLDLLTRFALLEGASESGAAVGGSAPDRYWHHAAEAREKAPKPNSREFEARILFHQSEFEWRKMMTRYTAIEKSKRLLDDYSGTNILKKYQPTIRERSETGKDYTFLPHQLAVAGDYNTFKNPKKDDPAWISSKQIDFKDSLQNYVEAEFIALPNTTYKCWVYAGGCCQEVWNGSYQATEVTTSNKGKQVPIDPGSQMAAALPFPSGLKKNHDDHKPKPEKGAKTPPDHPKTAAKWDWIQIPLPKTYLAPGAKAVRILTDQPGFGVKYILISSTRSKAPDEAAAKDLAKEAVAGPAAKPEVKGTAEAKEWFIIGPFPEGLGNEQAPEKEIDVTKSYKGKTADVKWRLAGAAIKGAQAEFNWEKAPFNPKDQVSVYALIHVKAPQAMDAKLWIGHDDGGRAWLNGQKVHDREKSGALKADEFNDAIKLEEGWNRLLIKVNNNNDKFGMIMRITDPAKAAIPGLEYSPYGDSLEQP